MTIREVTTSPDLNNDVRELMLKFWEAYDKLWVDMDNLTEDEFFIRQHEMWGYRNKAQEIGNDLFLITLSGLEAKAKKLYGNEFSKRYIDFLFKK